MEVWTPHNYQLKAIPWLMDRPRCALWSPMGSGKTSIILTAISALRLTGQTRYTLVLGPLRVARSVWLEQALHWSHLRDLRISPIIGNETQRINALRREGANVWTINYENVPWLIEKLKNQPWPFDTVIADESVKLKGYRITQGGQRARALSTIAFDDLKRATKGAARWINASGLPAPNGLADLWGQTWFLDKGARLGNSFQAFSDRWFSYGPGAPGQQELRPMPYAQQQITEALADICLAIDVGFKVEQPNVIDIAIELPPNARKVYKDMERKMYADIRLEAEQADKRITAFNASSKMMKCRQIAGGAMFIDKDNVLWEKVHDEKIMALESIVDETGGAPVLVFYHFRHALPRLKAAFPKGRELVTKRDEDAWNSGHVPILFMHPASAGHGLNLQYGGNIAVFFELDYSYDNRAQSIERIGPLRQRQAGFNRPVLVYNLVSRDTTDELILESLKGKKTINELLIEAAKRNGDG